jgi:predicted nucleotidyltransferase
MKTVGIIAEYNPFHNGHAYQIQKAKELTGADYCIVVISGDFVQRGAPAMMNKYLRAENALRNGADLVLELPVYYALGSAEYFASGAVALLDKLGMTNSLCFGSECGDISLLSAFAAALLSENELFQSELNRNLKYGMSYPSARNAALRASSPQLADSPDIMSSPNNILGIEYCKALMKRESSIIPYTLLRTGAAYQETDLRTDYSSALGIRNALQTSHNLCEIKENVPPSVYAQLEKHYGVDCPISSEDFSTLLHYELLSLQTEGYQAYPDIDIQLSERISGFLPEFQSWDSFCALLKTKNLTYTRISRSLMHILLHIEQEDLSAFCENDYICYARILGFRETASPLLSAIKAHSSIPLISKLADADRQLTPLGMKMLDKDIYASHIYEMVTQHKFHTPSLSETNEYRRQIIRI